VRTLSAESLPMLRSASCVALLLFAAPIHADIVHLTTGGKLEGEVQDLGDRLVVKLRTGKTEIPREKVARIETKPVPWVEYAKRRQTLDVEDASVGGRSAARRYGFASWCLEQGLKQEAIDELLIGAQREPGHEPTRKRLLELGLEEYEGRWVTREEKMTAEGYVFHQGKWLPFEEYEEVAAEQTAMAAMRKHQIRAREALKDLRNPNKSEAAKAKLTEIPPNALVRPLGEALRTKDAGVRWYALEKLKEFAKLGTGPYFFQASLEDPLEEHRAFARDTLKELGGVDEYVPYYLTVLRNDQGYARAYAADALADIGDPRAVVHLVHTLYTVTLEVRAQKATVSQPIDSVAVDTVGAGVVTVETPRNSLVSVSSTVQVPAGESLELAQASAAGALARITGVSYGTDARAWVDWWKDEGKKKYASK